MNYKAEPLGTEKYRLGEGPCYDPSTGVLSWVDIMDGKLWRMGPGGKRSFFDLGQPIGAAVPIFPIRPVSTDIKFLNRIISALPG